MAAKDILSEAGKSIIGKVTKAVIEIEDNRIRDVEIAPMQSGFGVKSNLTGNIKLVSAQELPEAVNSLRSMAESAVGTKKTFTVRFNPSKLTLQAQGGGMVAKTNFAANGTSTVEYASMTPHIQLGVELIFDDASNADSFLSEKLSAGGMVRTGIDVVRNKTHSVQPQVEGFIATLRNPYTRNVTFHWGTMSYSGVVNYLNAEYTMFSISGHPVRATVSMGILCVDETVRDGNMGQWGEYFRTAFGTGDATNLESVSQNVGNLLNFQL